MTLHSRKHDAQNRVAGQRSLPALPFRIFSFLPHFLVCVFRGFSFSRSVEEADFKEACESRRTVAAPVAAPLITIKFLATDNKRQNEMFGRT